MKCKYTQRKSRIGKVIRRKNMKIGEIALQVSSEKFRYKFTNEGFFYDFDKDCRWSTCCDCGGCLKEKVRIIQ